VIETLHDCEVLRGLDESMLARVAAVAVTRTFERRERPFALGDAAIRFFVIRSGRVELCAPISVRGQLTDVSLEVKGPGSALGWSAFVKPHRFRLTARASERADLIQMQRRDMIEILSSDPLVACRFMERIAEMTAERLLTVQALWVRELQRSVRLRNHADE